MLSSQLLFAAVICVAGTLTLVDISTERGAIPVKIGEDKNGIQTLAGRITCESFVVSKDQTVFVSADLEIVAEKEIRIDGAMVVHSPALEARSKDAPSMQLRAGESISVSGQILGGKGRDDRSLHGVGGNGTSVYIEAPVVWVDGVVRGGDGGVGSPRMSDPPVRGADGGSVDVFGVCFTNRPVSDLPVEWQAIDSGLIGGNGGNFTGRGGDAIVHNHRTVALGQQISMPTFVPARTWLILACPDGNPGIPGSNATGGGGAQGPTGDNGSQASPNGRSGGTGIIGGSVTGGPGGPGGHATNCCPDDGGAGGKGAKGGNATGGPGGKGGTGGNAYPGSTGVGGTGGQGGNGGTGTPGGGGLGGNGASSKGGPGLGGEPGTGSPGLAGPGGDPGSPGGSSGPAGGPGGVGGAAGGGGGSAGGNCPQ